MSKLITQTQHHLNYNEFLHLLKLDEPYISFRPRVICQDGFSVSIQAGFGNYCYPRDFSGNYSQVELGYPSDTVYSWLPYMEGDLEFTNPTDTVYAYVPTVLVYSELIKHGTLSLNQETQFRYVQENLRHVYDNF